MPDHARRSSVGWKSDGRTDSRCVMCVTRGCLTVFKPNLHAQFNPHVLEAVSSPLPFRKREPALGPCLKMIITHTSATSEDLSPSVRASTFECHDAGDCGAARG